MSKTLFGRLLWVFVGILVLMSVSIGWLAIRSQEQFAMEADQRLNVDLAANLAAEFAPFIQEMPDYDGVEDTIHDLMVYNPRIEIYVLDTTGTILSYFSDPESIVRKRVDVGPIRTFLGKDISFPLLGDDPRSPTDRKPFSAARIDLGNRDGYLYVILGGELVEASLGTSEGSHITHLFVTAAGLILLASVLVGAGLFFLHTRRFQTMKWTLRRFAEGDSAARIPIHQDDDVAELSRAFNDMADRIEAAMEDLRRTDRLRREQVANISHDLKTPLSSILGFVETIEHRGDTLSEEQRTRYLKVIRDNAQTLGRLIAELSELARLDSLTMELNLETFNIEELVQDVTMSFEPMAGTRHITLETGLSGNHPYVDADLGLMERVLSNLIRNAIQYTESGGNVIVRVRESGDRVHVDVVDTGSGIAEKDLPHVTQRFFRADKSRTSGAGMGLGLSIAETILHLHDSALRISSKEGQGSTMSFSFQRNSTVHE